MTNANNEYTLKVPLDNGGTKITKVTLRRMRVKDIKAIEAAAKGGTDMDAGVVALANACDIPVEVIDEMDVEDFTALSEKLASFLPKVRRPTGK